MDAKNSTNISSSDTTIGCKTPINDGDFEVSVVFKGDHPGSGFFTFYYEDRPPQYACITKHKHGFCGWSGHCDETSRTVDFGLPNPLYFVFCRECAEKIKKSWKLEGEGPMITSEMNEQVRLEKERETAQRCANNEMKKKFKMYLSSC